ncbi:anti-sigma factor family protein [Hoyosella subflava]|uniref:Putative transmembrane anti-sigma factor n=1 Tax=Hoyosella subflava (strain DSM 45089 / JCM 17490 / NBRC 109087 / DQS3-9A1) TaxID=443218 RepID=F6EGG0_HOYSD|nr:hypothetical protein [Hoyosella subflava]AEF41013.1 Putative transmembrane anti-sigma factor [Hoyosella subflava DQS3-9A1]
MKDKDFDIEQYLFGQMSQEERDAAEQYLAEHPDWRAEVETLRALEDELGDIPHEFFLDGAPEDADLVLARAVRQARSERPGRVSRTMSIALGATAAAMVALIGVAVVIGYQIGTSSTELDGPAPVAISGSDPATGATLIAELTPAAGWIRLTATVTGIPAGEPCYLIVVDGEGNREIAGGWLVSETGEAEGTTLSGSALVAPDDVAEVRVENVAGQTFVAVAPA